MMRETSIFSGPKVEKILYSCAAGREPANIRAEKRKLSSPAMARANAKLSWKQLERRLAANILPGDLVVVHRQSDARSGEIVVALFEDEATVKTLSRKDGHVWLLPENPDYEPIDGTYAEIIGKVVAVVRRY